MALEPFEVPQGSGLSAEGQSRRGRKPLKLFEGSFSDTFIGYLEEGLGFKAACDLCGVSSTSARKYIREGLQDMEAGRDTSLAQFAYEATAAMAEAKRVRILQIRKAANNPAFWGAAAWWLERSDPQNWGRQDRLAMSINGSVNLSERLEKIQLTDNEANTLGAILARIDNTGNEGDSSASEPVGFGDSSQPDWDR